MNSQFESTNNTPQPFGDRIHVAKPERVTSLADSPGSRSRLLSDFRPSLWLSGVLIASGLFHFVLLWVTASEWNGPLSPRKPALFGVSGGVTIWSIAWVLTQMDSWKHDRFLANLMATCLFLEVGLITLQYWRGVPSHFNHANLVDAVIETAMLGLILIVVVGIACLVWRSRRLPPMVESLAIAIRAGLWLLLASCILGVMVSIVGEINMAYGRSSETWGRAGVLKYPHGAALHAIQLLPILSALLNRFRVHHAAWLLRSAVAAHILFMVHALWQTLHGRERLDVDLVGGSTLAAAGILILLPIAAIIWKAVSMPRKAM